MWLDRAENMVELTKSLNAPADIYSKAYDALQEFVSAKELRKVAYKNKNGYRLRLKANRHHSKGKRLFNHVLENWFNLYVEGFYDER